ncbi:MAG: hypothetical protein LIP06_13500 [Tannerellaceae bacterium]|nr:hypothetical protein [Tannerellaceae bacterium]
MWVPENSNTDEKIKEWLQKKGILESKNVAVLWSRFSGKKGEAHIEHDTSYTGIRRMIWIAYFQGYELILIVGDAYSQEKHKNKYPLMAECARHLGANTYDLTEFWRDPSVEEWGGNTRLGQLYFYDYLNRKFNILKHLGSRSGNLEAMALLGHETRYLEEDNSESASRMEKWHTKSNGRTKDGGMAPGYERILINSPFTRTGKKKKKKNSYRIYKNCQKILMIKE